MKKYIFLLFNAFLLFCLMANTGNALEQIGMPEAIGKNIVAEFRPEAAVIKVKNKTAWIEMTGGVIDGIRIEKMKLLAELEETIVPNENGSESSKSSLAKMIRSSKGEVVLAEKDVNDYFKKNENPDGFSNLQFDFTPAGFTATGNFITKIIIDLDLPIFAKGILGLHDNGVYLDKTSITVKGINQPDALTNLLLSKINPLLEFKDIPFPVAFEKIKMTEKAAVMTGEPREFKGGVRWEWNKPQLSK